MFRIKIGEHITIGDISRGPRAVVECDHINEFVDMLKAGILSELVLISDVENRTHVERMRAKLREYGIED